MQARDQARCSRALRQPLEALLSIARNVAGMRQEMGGLKAPRHQKSC